MRRNTSLSISSMSSLASPTSDSSHEHLSDKESFLWARPIAPPLPSPLIKHADEQRQSSYDKWKPRLQQFTAIAIVSSLLLCFYCSPTSSLHIFPFSQSHGISDYELVGQASPPDHPTPSIVTDKRGHSRWTVSVPEPYEFLLRPDQYEDICRASEDLSRQVAHINGRSRIEGKQMKHTTRPYYARDRGFMQVEEAQRVGLLPPISTEATISVVGRTIPDQDSAAVCQKSLTFVMESNSAGFGHTLLLLWLSYGLAAKENRAFFIDDSRWAYGNYTSYFPVPPQPDCAPPPASQIVPCPHEASHLVVSAATAPWTFGPSFHAHYAERKKRARGAAKANLQAIYSLLHTGYEDSFSSVGEDATFARARVAESRQQSAETGNAIVGIHIRRGDRHPFEPQFSRDYLPLERYTLAAQTSLHRLSSPSSRSANAKTTPPIVLLASDDPDISTSPSSFETFTTSPPSTSTSTDLVPEIQRPQSRIILASKRVLPPSIPLREPGSAYTKHVDENSGWEGGFYASSFWGLGRGHVSPSPLGSGKVDRDVRVGVGQHAMRLRELVARAYLSDSVVLAQTDGVVCASSSAACRVLAVMGGWEGESDGDRWMNVDDGRGWSWDGR